MDIYLEIFGYIGTALVLFSMMMTSVTRLRWFNIAGSIVSMTYAALCNTWPVVFLNFGLIIINSLQLVRLYKLRSLFSVVSTSAADQSAKYFLKHYSKDIKQYFPDFELKRSDETEIFIVYDGAEAVGILVGERLGDVLRVDLDYVSPKYRDRSVARFLFGRLKDHGIKSLSATTLVEKHRKYLLKMDFKDIGGVLVKNL